MKRILAQLTLLAITAYSGLPLFGQTCDISIKSIEGPLGYNVRKNSPRCEGLYESPVSSPVLEVVSFNIGAIVYELDSNAVLYAAADIAADTSIETVNFRALALPANTYYRMDATLSGNDILRWPVGDVLLPAKLYSDRIGIYGWIDHEMERLLIPIRVSQTIDTIVQHIEDQFYLQIRYSGAIERMFWRFPESETELGSWQAVDRADLLSGYPATITMPEDPCGIITVEITAELSASDDWLQLEVKLLRPCYDE